MKGAENERLARVGHKRCGRCGVVKETGSFDRCATRQGGFASTCKKCRAQQRVAQYERMYDPVQLKDTYDKVVLARENKGLKEKGLRKCQDCGQTKKLTEFSARGYKGVGGRQENPWYSRSCLSCQQKPATALNNRNRELAVKGERMCSECGRIKDSTRFYSASSGGLMAQCKTCYNLIRQKGGRLGG
jgi:hypothetical protein